MSAQVAGIVNSTVSFLGVVTSILPVFPSQLQVNVFPLELFFVLLFIFSLYQPVLVRTFALVCLYSLDLAIMVVSGNMIYQAFGMFLISNLLHMRNPCLCLVPMYQCLSL